MAVGELNLVPYLDIIVNLNMFLLFTFQVVLELRVINFNPPASGSSTDIVGKNQEDKTVVLTVMITKAGHMITTDTESGTKQVPMKSGTYDFAQLETELEGLRKRPDIHVDPDNLIVVAEPAITYDKVVATLDACRYMADGTTELFPHVTLGLAVGTQ